MKRLALALIPIAAILSGCAQVPLAENFPISTQKVARTAHHWDVVADDVVNTTLHAIAKTPQLQGRGVYVPLSKSTPFNTAFREFLITRFVERGTNVSVCKQVAKSGFALDAPDINVQYDTQIIAHSFRPPLARPGDLTILAAGVAVLRNLGMASEPTAAVIAGAAGIDLWATFHARPTHTEIIITTTIAENNRFITRRSDVYYVPDEDANLFIQRFANRSTCPENKTLPMAEAYQETWEEQTARNLQITRAMRRINPDWRGPAVHSAYSY